MRLLSAILAIAVIAFCSCSWSAEQREILNAFNSTASAMESGDWDTAMDMLSTATAALLDSTVRDISARGLEGYECGADLLPVIYREYIDFDGEVTMIFVQGGTAELTVSSDDSRKYSMILEGSDWKLDIAGPLSRGLAESLRGSYLE